MPSNALPVKASRELAGTAVHNNSAKVDWLATAARLGSGWESLARRSFCRGGACPDHEFGSGSLCRLVGLKRIGPRVPATGDTRSWACMWETGGNAPEVDRLRASGTLGSANGRTSL